MKKNILLVIVTAIICVGVTAFAYSYNASDIGYKSINVENALDNLYNEALNHEITMDLLWTNPSPTTGFAPQTVNIDLSNYKYIAINTTYGGNGLLDDYYDGHKTIVEVGTTNIISGIYHSPDGGAATVRKVTVSTTGINFGYGKFFNGSNQVNDNYAVPLNVWGIK